jgi:S-adenosylmethionine synthetase
LKPVVEVRAHRPGALEMVERKGIGHPDTICDAIAEEVSIALSGCYLERFGAVLHHNVDKVLLRGGLSRPAFGGGEVLEPIELYVAGRATRQVGAERLPVREIVVETARSWLRAHLRHLDLDAGLAIHDLVRPGSVDLVGLFEQARAAAVPLANDTSIGVGFAPATRLETAVLAVDRALADARVLAAHPAFGEDLKVMGVRTGDGVALTVAMAQVDRHLRTVTDYVASVEAVRARALEAAGGVLGTACEVAVNTGDAPRRGRCYLTVTGTSAEAGDDGEVGRGNRVGGLITPHRPMTMEAAAGKNAITHVGKLYNILARELAIDLVAAVPGIAAAQVFLVSRIGRRIDDPQAVHVQLELIPGASLADLGAEVDGRIRAGLPRARALWRGVLERAFPIY